MVAAVVLAVSATAVTQAVTAAAAAQRAARQDRAALEMAEALADEVAALPFDAAADIRAADTGDIKVTIDGVERLAHAGVGHDRYVPRATLTGVVESIVPREVAENGIDYARTNLGVLGRMVNDAPSANSVHELADVTVEGGEEFARLVLVERHAALPGAAVVTARVQSPSGRAVSARRLLVPKD